MSAINLFNNVWERCNQVTALHSYLISNHSKALQPDELLRLEWVARVSALDLYFHELIIDRLVNIFLRKIEVPKNYYEIKLDVVLLDKTLSNYSEEIDSKEFKLQMLPFFEKETRQFLRTQSLQKPLKISENLKYCSDLELWQE